ncbi:hypothetical protein P8Q88_13310 [Qipengyuania sp. XHP0207]|uniref:hypothetical protein n=1 Tax=Qipengyuania sp. XHP0207 TaxID=3038078 RepID=UPI0024200077|nr:hypothetical protein [Qipengyuania sp. XHP0207]MDG5749153.1 hypothetical protein [Qipengyuania sp. XHP0207]
MPRSASFSTHSSAVSARLKFGQDSIIALAPRFHLGDWFDHLASNVFIHGIHWEKIPGADPNVPEVPVVD